MAKPATVIGDKANIAKKPGRTSEQVFLETIESLGYDGIKRQYNELRRFAPPDATIEHYRNNPERNRYPDIFCMDSTRVVLIPGPGKLPASPKSDSTSVTDSDAEDLVHQTDYIHANFVREHPKYGGPITYICTQGPVARPKLDGVDTRDEFWRMCWQLRVPCIMMLCDVEEKGQPKCEIYYPTNVTAAPLQFGTINIKCESHHVVKVPPSNDSILITQLLISIPSQYRTGRVDEKEERRVVHMKWANWPDKSVPKHPAVVLWMARFLRRMIGRNVVVHCSAGIGRSGCLVAVSIAVEQLRRQATVNVMEIMRSMRCQRLQAVQTQLQFQFIHRALLSHIVRDRPLSPLCAQYAMDYKQNRDEGELVSHQQKQWAAQTFGNAYGNQG